jgi:hypothetical protein
MSAISLARRGAVIGAVLMLAIPSAAYCAEAGGWILDTGAGCKVWNPHYMNRMIPLVTAALLLLGIAAVPTAAVAQEPKGKTCHMEQQCHWVNFKKICTYVKVCR